MLARTQYPVVISCLFLMLFSSVADSATQKCPDSNVAISHDRNYADANTACRAASEAIAFMAGCGLDTSIPITINIVEAFVSPHSVVQLGQFDSKAAQISISSFARCCELAAKRPIFRQPISPALYRSFIVHEVAHAIAQYNFTIERPAQVAQEYIAYSVQFATMEATLRDHILNAFDNAAFVADREISELFLALDPETFAVKAYRHFQAPENGTAFLQRILTGDFQPKF